MPWIEGEDLAIERLRVAQALLIHRAGGCIEECCDLTGGNGMGRAYWIRTSDQRIKSPLLYQLS